MSTARRHGLPSEVGTADVLVIGDTPRDVACAHAHGASIVAVATGQYDADALVRAGADVVFEDLSDTGAVMRAVFGVRRC